MSDLFRDDAIHHEGTVADTEVANWPTKSPSEWLVIPQAADRHPNEFLTDEKWARACGTTSSGPWTQRIHSALCWTALEQGMPARPRITKVTGFGMQLKRFIEFPDKEVDVLPAFEAAFMRIYRVGLEKNWQIKDHAGVRNEVAYLAEQHGFGQVDEKASQFIQSLALAEMARAGNVSGFHGLLMAKPPVLRVNRENRPGRMKSRPSAPSVASPTIAPTSMIASPATGLIKRPEPTAPHQVQIHIHHHFHGDSV
jgi:hypothetical protein